MGGVLAHFSPNEATRLVETLKNVRHTMKHVSQTFLGLLSAIFPVLSIVYKTALSQIGPIPEDWREVPSIAEVCYPLCLSLSLGMALFEFQRSGRAQYEIAGDPKLETRHDYRQSRTSYYFDEKQVWRLISLGSHTQNKQTRKPNREASSD